MKTAALLLLACLAGCTRPTTAPAAAVAPPTPWEQEPVLVSQAESDSLNAAYRF